MVFPSGSRPFATASLGVPELTSEAPMSERFAFWERARRESVLLTEGMLLDQHLVSLGAVDAAATPDVDTWGTIEGITDLTSDAPAESTYYRGGCVPLATTLGPGRRHRGPGGRGERARPDRP